MNITIKSNYEFLHFCETNPTIAANSPEVVKKLFKLSGDKADIVENTSHNRWGVSINREQYWIPNEDNILAMVRSIRIKLDLSKNIWYYLKSVPPQNEDEAKLKENLEGIISKLDKIKRKEE